MYHPPYSCTRSVVPTCTPLTCTTTSEASGHDDDDDDDDDDEAKKFCWNLAHLWGQHNKISEF